MPADSSGIDPSTGEAALSGEVTNMNADTSGIDSPTEAADLPAKVTKMTSNTGVNPTSEEDRDETVENDDKDEPGEEDKVANHAEYVPKDDCANQLSTSFGCYTSLDGVSLHPSPLDEETVVNLAQPDDMVFSIMTTTFTVQYTTIKMKITAPGINGLADNTIGMVTVKCGSIESCELQAFSGSDVADQLRLFCPTIDKVEHFPAELVKFTATCDKINVDVQDYVRKWLHRRHPVIAQGLDRIRERIEKSTDKKLSFLFHSQGASNMYINLHYGAISRDVPRNRDISRADYIFGKIFLKSPRAHRLHMAYAPARGSALYPTDLRAPLPVTYTLDNHDEYIVANVCGSFIEFGEQVGTADRLNGQKFAAHAIELPHYRGQGFLLVIETPLAEDVALPRMRDPCTVIVHNVKRTVSTPGSTVPHPRGAVLTSIVSELWFGSSKAARSAAPIKSFRAACEHLFVAGTLTDDMVREVLPKRREALDTVEDRIPVLANTWAEAGVLVTETGYIQPSVPADPCKHWGAERISLVIPGLPATYSVFQVILPLVPKSEALEDGTRPVIAVEFPKLSFADLKGKDVRWLASQIWQHISDPNLALNVSFLNIASDKASEATFNWLLDFTGGTKSNLFETMPWMRLILDEPERVPKYLQEKWAKLDDDKKAAYRGLDNLTQRFKWIAGVAGSGKTELIVFIIMMAMFGENGTEHPQKILYTVNHNAVVQDFALRLEQEMVAMGKEGKVLRNHGIDTEIDDWLVKHAKLLPRRQEPFDRENAERACMSITNHFLAEAELSKLSRDAHEARDQQQNPKEHSLSIQQGMFRHFEANRDKFPKLCEELAAIESGAKLNGNWASSIKKGVMDLLAAYLEAFNGIICGTPYALCRPQLVRSFKSTMIFNDEGAKMHDLELLQLVRFHTPALFLVVGDPAQLGAFVHARRENECVVNPWEQQLQISALERAMCHGNVVDTALTLNHRAMGGLSWMPSDLIYRGTMEPYHVGADAWTYATKLHRSLLCRLSPSLHRQADMESNRVLFELQGSTVVQIGSSYTNPQHVTHVVNILVEFFRDKDLQALDEKDRTVCILAAYMEQALAYSRAMRELVTRSILTEEQVKSVSIKTMDISQGTSAALVIVDYVRNKHPGFNDDSRRICVASTRAVHAEIILMHRGIFFHGKVKEESGYYKRNVRLLEQIYSHVAAHHGLVILDSSKIPNLLEKDKQAETDEPKTGMPKALNDYRERCHCRESREHRTTECMEPLRCLNCHGLDHTKLTCEKPRQLHCYTCREFGHSHKNCPRCPKCGDSHPKGGKCMGKRRCFTCGNIGHENKDCLQRLHLYLENPVCHNCGEKGHAMKTCDFCQHCQVKGHSTRRCPQCKQCKQYGHKKQDYPNKPCEGCGEIGHSLIDCPPPLVDLE